MRERERRVRAGERVDVRTLAQEIVERDQAMSDAQRAVCRVLLGDSGELAVADAAAIAALVG